MGKLKEMAVQRVDGVDRPAIKKRWVLVKNEDGAAEIEKDYRTPAAAVVEAIAKEGVAFSDETMELLKQLVETLELDVEFTAKAEDEGDDDETDETDESETDETDETDDADGDDTDETDETDETDGDDETDVAKTYTGDEVEALLAKFAATHGIEIPGTVEKRADTTPLIVKKSRQPKAQDGEAPVRKSVFANVVNGKATEPYQGARRK